MLAEVFKVLFLSVMLYGCSSPREDKEGNLCNDSLRFERVKFFPESGKGAVTYYDHYIYINGYQENCFNSINWIKIAKAYNDSCKFKRPISAVIFIKDKMDLDREDYGNINWAEIQNNSILGFYFSDEKKEGSFPLTTIFYYESGKEKKISVE